MLTDILRAIFFFFFFGETNTRIHIREMERGSNTKAHHNSTQKL